MCYFIYAVPSYIPSITSVTNTDSSLTVNWISNPNDAYGYVVNVTENTTRSNDFIIITQMVKGGSTNTITFSGLQANTAYIVSVRAYQDVVGPESAPFGVYLEVGILTINSTSIDGNRYRINCITLYFINVHWIFDDVMITSSKGYSLLGNGRVNHTLIVGRPAKPTNVTCVARYSGVIYDRTIELEGTLYPL